MPAGSTAWHSLTVEHLCNDACARLYQSAECVCPAVGCMQQTDYSNIGAATWLRKFSS